MWVHRLYLTVIYLIVNLKFFSYAEDVATWKWVCQDGKCIKTALQTDELNSSLSIEACKMFCNKYGLLWPKPTGAVVFGNHLSKLNFNNIEMKVVGRGSADRLMYAADKRFRETILATLPKNKTPKNSGKKLMLNFVNKNPSMTEFSLEFDESYTLTVSGSDDEKVNATISAPNFFGLRHGLETLSQLIFYDDIRHHLLIVRDVNIVDKPVYPYRGFLLDTARNYYSVDSILQTINAMAVVKLNTFHWHITDSHSFPFVSERRPTLSKLGAYSPSKVYTKEDIATIVEYGRQRGVRVLPEFDAPAHVGEGWQDTDLTVCFKAQPWTSYCVEPPCGQLNPIKDELYNVLEDIYRDMSEYFQPDMFHMGGDEVSEKCWESSKEIQEFIANNKWPSDKSGFLLLWDYFQKKAQEKAYLAFGKKLPLILWTSTLTDFAHVKRFLNSSEYIIQVWTTGLDPQITGLLENGYRLIISNYDALYLDCGFSSWVGEGNNWCSPFIGWQKVYDNNLQAMSSIYHSQILGGEAALWSEQADSESLDSRLWPRLAALAERLWSNPTTKWIDALERMLHIRERLVKLGIHAESIQPEWCYQNEGQCLQ